MAQGGQPALRSAVDSILYFSGALEKMPFTRLSERHYVRRRLVWRGALLLRGERRIALHDPLDDGFVVLGLCLAFGAVAVAGFFGVTGDLGLHVNSFTNSAPEKWCTTTIAAVQYTPDLIDVVWKWRGNC
jgi:hypothetical protein